MTILLPVLSGLLFLVFVILSLRAAQGFDRKVLVILIIQYSTCLMFAIVEYLYMLKKGTDRIFIILLLWDLLWTALYGMSLRDIVKKGKIDEANARKAGALSIYLILEALGLIGMLMIR